MVRIYDAIKKIGARVFNLNESEISENIARDNTPEWDSLNHLILLTEIEKELGIKFKASEITKIKSLKDIENILEVRGIKPQR